MKIGLGVMCHYDDEGPEPEGVVLFDDYPKVGDEIILCMGRVWIITELDFSDYSGGYPVHCKRKLDEQVKHKCGTHFSSGPVDVGVISTHNGRMAYSCEKCVAEKAAVKAREDAQEASRFAKRWVG